MLLVVADDSDATGGVGAYIGGIDITTGRYDDQNHFLFKTMETSHIDDFKNVYSTRDDILS